MGNSVVGMHNAPGHYNVLCCPQAITTVLLLNVRARSDASSVVPSGQPRCWNVVFAACVLKANGDKFYKSMAAFKNNQSETLKEYAQHAGRKTMLLKTATKLACTPQQLSKVREAYAAVQSKRRET
jgi:hypothetical protein